MLSVRCRFMALCSEVELKCSWLYGYCGVVQCFKVVFNVYCCAAVYGVVLLNEVN